jgi:excisionase family DNA binding protein
LYVRLPAHTGKKLDRASEVLGMAKKDLVAGLVDRYVDPDSRRGVAALSSLSPPPGLGGELARGEPVLGLHAFHPFEPSEVLSERQAASLLQIEEASLRELAEKGSVPGRKLGDVWRFSRSGLLAWLASGP